jgi:hypothetical protein
MRKFTAFFALVVCTLAGPAAAQTCVGRASFADAPWQARVESTFSSESHTFGPSLLRGGRTVFGGANVDLVGYNSISETAASIGGTVGAEGRIASRLTVCPVVTVLHQFGPSVSGNDLSVNVAAFGGRMGFVASENQTLQVVPMIGMDAQWEHDSVTSGGNTNSDSRTFTVARLGVGFVLNRKTSIVPEIIELFGVGGSTAFRVTAAFGFGK